MRIKHKRLDPRRCFGVELEANATHSSDDIRDAIFRATSRDVFYSGWQQTKANDYWHLKIDSTCGWEIASFKGRNVRDLKEMASVAKELSKIGLGCNQSCGFHVHIDLSDFSAKKAGLLLARWLRIERIMMQLVPIHRSNNKYCRQLTKVKKYSRDYYYDPFQLWKQLRPMNFKLHRNSDKKVTLNFVNFATCLWYDKTRVPVYPFCDPSRRTVEFRFPEGTFSSRDVKNWVRLFLSFVDTTTKSSMPRNLKTIRKGDEFLEYVGLNSTDSCVFLSKPLMELKMWLLERLSMYSRTAYWHDFAEHQLEVFEKDSFVSNK